MLLHVSCLQLLEVAGIQIKIRRFRTDPDKVYGVPSVPSPKLCHFLKTIIDFKRQRLKLLTNIVLNFF
jgi:hypothetical protein